jgi:hypothetical protein
LTTQSEHGALRLVKSCARCDLWPCACSYIVKLSEDGPLAHLRSAAIEEYRKPMPHRDGCPCPRCYSLRMRSWEPDQLTGAS